MDTFVTLTVAEAEGFRDVPTFLGYCRECGSMGATWSCPPVTEGAEAVTAPWEYLTVVGRRVTPPTVEALHKVADELRERLLNVERAVGGRALAGDGRCRVCERCTRPEGLPCRHPERVRLSLEAVGYNVSALAERAGLSLEWKRPRYLCIVMGLLHNDKNAVEKMLHGE